MPSPPDLIGTVEAASLLGVNRATLTRLVAAGKIAPFSQLPGPNGALLFRRDAIEKAATKRKSAVVA